MGVGRVIIWHRHRVRSLPRAPHGATTQSPSVSQREGLVVATLLVVGLMTSSYTPSTQRASSHGPSLVHAAPTSGKYRLAYELDGDMYLAHWNGTHPVKIADGGPGICGSYGGEGPIWSPDGRYLAFRGSVEGASSGSQWACPSTVSIADQTGQIISTFRVGMGWKVSWSPDSTRIAVWAPRDRLSTGVGWDRTIGIYGVDGVQQTLLTFPRRMMGGGDFDPRWSHGGRSLLVPDEVVVPIDGSAPRLSASLLLSWDLAYSPDGTRIAYIDYTYHGALEVAAADGSSPRVLLHGATNPVWSPSGDQIAFELLNSPEIRVVDVATGTVTSLVRKSNPDLIGFSPDGERILFSNTDPAVTKGSLWSVRTDGSDLQLLVKGTYWGEWQP